MFLLCSWNTFSFIYCCTSARKSIAFFGWCTRLVPQNLDDLHGQHRLFPQPAAPRLSRQTKKRTIPSRKRNYLFISIQRERKKILPKILHKFLEQHSAPGFKIEERRDDRVLSNDVRAYSTYSKTVLAHPSHHTLTRLYLPGSDPRPPAKKKTVPRGQPRQLGTSNHPSGTRARALKVPLVLGTFCPRGYGQAAYIYCKQQTIHSYGKRRDEIK